MKTEVIMKRNLWDCEISQKSKSEFFSATDLVKAGNKWRRNNDYPDFNFSAWLKSKQTQEFIHSLQIKYNTLPILKSTRKTEHTWVHPLLFIDLALAMSPTLKIEVYEWLFDHLIKYRNDSGDSYKAMCGALYNNSKAPSKFNLEIRQIAKKIADACGVTDWQCANEYQLKLRDKIHDNITLLTDVLKDNEHAVDIAILKSRGMIKE